MSAPAARGIPNSKRTGSAAIVPEVPPAPDVVETPAEIQPTPEETAALAYSYWEARGGQGGSAEEDWFRAEQQLRAGQ